VVNVGCLCQQCSLSIWQLVQQLIEVRVVVSQRLSLTEVVLYLPLSLPDCLYPEEG
jgi:hypothetical protein